MAFPRRETSQDLFRKLPASKVEGVTRFLYGRAPDGEADTSHITGETGAASEKDLIRGEYIASLEPTGKVEMPPWVSDDSEIAP